jgi:hypothetical protein
MTTKTSSNKLNRFTSLPVLLDLLISRRLVFSDPKFWDDKNDVELLEIYKNNKYEGKRDIRVFALCFLTEHETIHHWKTFADGICGCCVEFDKSKLIKLLSAHKNEGKNLRFGSVAYQKLKDVCDGSIGDDVEMIPFKKRWPYRYEKEFRVILECDTDGGEISDIDLAMITKITFSQKMPKPLFETLREYLRRGSLGIPLETKINHSTIYENKYWIGKFRRIAQATSSASAS